MSKEIKNYGRSVKNTFENRGTGYVEGHPLFGEEFFKDPIRTSRWNG